MNIKKISKNYVFILVSSLISVTIGLFFVPYIIDKVGENLYGYIGLCDSFISIASIATTALSSMACRYIVVEGDNERINNDYINALFFGSIIISIIVIVAGLIFTANLDIIFIIPNNILDEVKLTFILSIMNFVISVATTVVIMIPQILNIYYYKSIGNIIGNVMKIMLFYILFSYFKPKIWYYPLGLIIYSLFSFFVSVGVWRKYGKEIKINIKYFSTKKIFTLLKSGLWNSIYQVAFFMISGVDIMFANWFLDEAAMTVITVVNSIQNSLSSFVYSLCESFETNLYRKYAENNIIEYFNEIKKTTKIQNILLSIPFCGIIVFGREFLTFWNPLNGKGIAIIYLIMVFKIIQWVFYVLSKASINIFSSYNRLSKSTITNIVIGLLNILIVFLIVNNVDNYVYKLISISCISSVIFVIYYLFIQPLLLSGITSINYMSFIKLILDNSLNYIFITIIFMFIKYLFRITNFIEFIIVILFSSIIGYILLIVFNRRYLINERSKN